MAEVRTAAVKQAQQSESLGRPTLRLGIAIARQSRTDDPPTDRRLTSLHASRRVRVVSTGIRSGKHFRRGTTFNVLLDIMLIIGKLGENAGIPGQRMAGPMNCLGRCSSSKIIDQLPNHRMQSLEKYDTRTQGLAAALDVRHSYSIAIAIYRLCCHIDGLSHVQSHRNFRPSLRSPSPVSGLSSPLNRHSDDSTGWD